MKNIIYILCIVFLVFSCENHSEDDLIDSTPVETVTYTENVKPVIDNNCLSCHSNPPINGAPTSLVTFDDVRLSTQNTLINRISLQAGEAGAMPLGGARLPQVTIDLIQQWADQGFVE